MITFSIHRGRILHFPRPTSAPERNYQYFSDGILVVRDGLIEYLGEACDFLAEHRLNSDDIIHHEGLILPGFIDAHVHYAQVEMIASYGEQLFDWLNNYTFPTEKKFIDRYYAKQQAEFFIAQLFAHGTTTAAVFATVHEHSVDMFFEAAEQYQARMICGKVLMDRFCPDTLRDNPKLGYWQSKELIEHWHHNGRNLYAVTPRFAPTSTPQQLQQAASLLREYPDVYMQTHLSENLNEIKWVKDLFPTSRDYLDVYESAGLLTERSIFGHGVHLCDSELKRLAANNATVACCPSSNLFLGSGLFPFHHIKDVGVNIAFASDIGAGTDLSLLANLADAYKICQLQGKSLNVFHSLYHSTQGAAVGLKLTDKIGNLNPGTEADFIEVNPTAFPMLQQRVERATSLESELFAVTTLGDERVINRTYVMGKCVFERTTKTE
ncbi:guanine deaminase [Vibrio nitrifigilis]|uniref:Guanine deaminase n=1 Tax=Vibrio nitrifigilis TaxID=2789781 RepID=A0ABS0GK96_9VIBR|nr:guanine deaminase [Vibrio nitrifigilis]MBF9002618.1 guanine deaminase [Vibrio nitrifigilis]